MQADNKKLDRVEEAPGNTITSRLSCRAKIESADETTVVRVPAWNRNAVQEVPY